MSEPESRPGAVNPSLLKAEASAVNNPKSCALHGPKLERLARIEVTIGGNKYLGVVDTGATCLFVAEKVVRELGLPVDAADAVTYRTVAPGGLQSLGSVRLDMGIGERQYSVRAQVVDVDNFDLLVSIAFLRRHGAVIDLLNERILFASGGAKLELLGEPAAAADALKVAVEDDAFGFARTLEFLRVDKLYPLPSRTSVDRRLQMAEGSRAADRAYVLALLMSMPRLVREYLANTPPLLPIKPLNLPFKEGAKPAHVRQFPMLPTRRKQLEEILRSWLKYGVVKAAEGHGQIPAFVVTGRENKARVVIDGRVPNELLEPWTYHTDSLEEIAFWMAEAMILSAIDMAAFYHQFPISEWSSRFFGIDGGALSMLELTRLPQGRNVAAAIACAFLNHILRPVAHLVKVYIDNIVIRTVRDDMAEHRRTLKQVLTLLHEAGVTLSLKSSYWGGVLLVERYGAWVPVCHVSRAWKGAEASYSAVKREAAALLNTVSAFQRLIGGEPSVAFETDSRAVSAILHHNGDAYLTRVGVRLSELGVREANLRHVSGADNAIADWASRTPAPARPQPEESELAAPPSPGLRAAAALAAKAGRDDDDGPAADSEQPPGPAPAQLHQPGRHDNAVITVEQQRADGLCRKVFDAAMRMERARKQDAEVRDMDAARDGWQRFAVRERLACRIEYPAREDPDDDPRYAVVVPKSERARVIKFYHDAYGHPKAFRLLALLRGRVWWDSMLSDAKSFCERCTVCQMALAKPATQAGRGTRESAGVGAHVYLDFGHFGHSDDDVNHQFMVMVDQATGLIAAAALRERRGENVVAALHSHWVRPFGPPEKLTVDGAPEFASTALDDYCRDHGITKITTSPYNPQANTAETAVKKVKTGLRTAMIAACHDPWLATMSWSRFLDCVVHNWNVTRSEAAGNVPSVLFFGRKPRHASSRYEETRNPRNPSRIPSGVAVERIAQIREASAQLKENRVARTKAYFDRAAQRLVIPIGAKVLRYTHKVGPMAQNLVRGSGPYVVSERLSETTYRLSTLDGTPIESSVHIRWLRPVS